MRNNVFVGGIKVDVSQPLVAAELLRYHYKLWTGNNLKVDIICESDDYYEGRNIVEIVIYRTYGKDYTEQIHRTMEGDRLSPYIYCLDRILLLGYGCKECTGVIDFTKPAPRDYIHIEDFCTDYYKLARKNGCKKPITIDFSDNKNYVSLILKF